MTPTYANMSGEVLGARSWINNTCGVPLSELVGFRSPYLIHNEVLRKLLADNGFLYDSRSVGGQDSGPAAEAGMQLQKPLL